MTCASCAPALRQISRSGRWLSRPSCCSTSNRRLPGSLRLSAASCFSISTVWSLPAGTTSKKLIRWIGPLIAAGAGAAAGACAATGTPVIESIAATANPRKLPRGMTEPPLFEIGHHLFADQLQRAHHHLGGDRGAEIELEQDAVDAELRLQLLEPVRHPLRSADHDLVAQHIGIGGGPHLLDFGAPPRVGGAFEP